MAEMILGQTGLNISFETGTGSKISKLYLKNIGCGKPIKVIVKMKLVTNLNCATAFSEGLTMYGATEVKPNPSIFGNFAYALSYAVVGLRQNLSI